MRWIWIVVALAGCQQASAPTVKVTLIYSYDASADTTSDALSSDGAPDAMCCVVPRVLTGLEKYDPNYASPYHNVMVNGNQQQQAYATCDQLSSADLPVRPDGNATQAEIDQYMAAFMAGPQIAISLPCLDPGKDPSYGRCTCGGDGGQAAQCANDGLSCAAGSQCWFDPGGTNGIGCTGVVTPCYYPWN